ncbi:MAG: DUF4234 domain-containing protein, partial [Oscillospiraceae bacterium]|nr:DUF4234 domain-containing protein [Oscillospiraceae bacterium]
MVQRNIVTYIILSIVTCGIFGIYWYYCIANDLYNARNQTIPTTPIVTIIVNIVTCGIYGIYVYFKWGQVMPEICAEKGVTVEDRSIVYLLIS